MNKFQNSHNVKWIYGSSSINQSIKINLVIKVDEKKMIRSEIADGKIIMLSIIEFELRKHMSHHNPSNDFTMNIKIRD